MSYSTRRSSVAFTTVGSALTDFQNKLQAFTLKDFHGRHFVLSSRLKDWLRSPLPNTSYTQIERLLEEAYRDQRETAPSLPVTSESVSRDSLLLFSVLLDIGYGYLVDKFRDDGFVDKSLPIHWRELQSWLQTEDNTDLDRAGGETVAKLFDQAQWKFCAPCFHPDDGFTYPHQRILPIPRRQRINDKGGTAQLWEVEVPEEFVGKSLRPQVETACYNSVGQYGKASNIPTCYRFALKSFREENFSLFQNEKEAFGALRGHYGMVKCLATFSWQEPGNTPDQSSAGLLDYGQSMVKTKNILFEYGEQDLDEYFVGTHPPFLLPEIQRFWETLLPVFEATETIHNFRSNRGPKFQGWHADIKPDNILLVNGIFKLADPGFAKFVRETGKTPEEVVFGGTWTYGAPERCRNDKGAVFQTIDIWSLGCVLSIAATWVVGGYSAVRDFIKVRQKAIQKVRHRTKYLSALKSADLFHNGTNVLEDVTGWHDVLRGSLRQVDNITGAILNLVDQQMLLGDPRQRSDAKSVCSQFKKILEESKAKTLIPMPESIMSALLEIDEEATSTLDYSSKVKQQIEAFETAPDRKSRKSIVLNPPLKRTAQRSGYLKAALSSASSKQKGPPLALKMHQVTNDRFFGRSHSGEEPIREKTPMSSPNHSITAPDLTSPRRDRPRKNTIPRPHEPQDVFRARKQIEQKRERSFKNPMPKKGDMILSKYIKDRDIIFLVDNAETMENHWEHAAFVLETLVMKAVGQDKDGMDLYFTFGTENLEDEKREKEFRIKMDSEATRPRGGFHTDLEKRVCDILSRRLQRIRHSRKDLTLIILTDGIWQGMHNKGAIDDVIVKFVQAVDGISSYRKRPLTFQFVQFGQNPEATSRLQYLDDVLAYERGIPDVVDTEHAYGDTYKMILGSFVEEYDFSETQLTPEITAGAQSPPLWQGESPPGHSAFNHNCYS